MKKAFTMLELVFVIVVVGIMAYVAVSSFSRNPLREAADQLVSHIRYTQHLAMMDDKFDPNDATWFRERWQIRFRLLLGEYGYVIFSDKNQDRNSNQANPQEIAIDPLSGELLNGFLNFEKGNLTKAYGVTNINTSCFVADGTLVTANRGSISFDSLGRPYSGVSNAATSAQYLLNQDCDITLSNNDGNITIRVARETGYTFISSQN